MVARARSLYLDGKTQEEVALSLQTTPKVIWRLMQRHSIPRRVAAKRDQRGSKNHMWKGDDASYKAFHQRMTKLRGQPQFCEVCLVTGPGRSYDWANLTGRFSDPKDYQRMCRSCHWKHDLKHKNLGVYATPGGGAPCLQS